MWMISFNFKFFYSLPRKWHSERGRPSNSNSSKPPSSRFSTQVPLSNHYKDILAQYAKTRQESQLQQQQQTSSNKINNKISQLNKKLSLLTVNKKQSTCTEHTNNSQKATKEVYFCAYKKIMLISCAFLRIEIFQK